MRVLKKVLLVISCVMMIALPFSGCTASGRKSNVIKISYVKAGYGEEWLNKITAAYTKEHPEVSFELEGDPDMTAKIKTRLETGSELPSIFMGLQTNWQIDAILGRLENLDDLYSEEVDNGKTFAEKVQPNYLDFGKVNGHYYAAGWTDGATGFIYNSGMFEKYNWSVPTTVEELVALCAKIKKDTAGKVAPFAWGGQVAAYWNFPTIAWWAQYEGMENMKTFNKYESPEVFKQTGRLKALEAFETLIGDDTNSIKDAMGKNHIMSQIAFVNGEAAMIPNGAWIENEVKKVMPDGFKMKLMKTPYIDADHKNDINYTAAGDFMIIPKDIPAAEKSVAKDFIKFMATDPMLKLFTEETNTPRPFVYDMSGLNVSEFGKSVLDVYTSCENLYMYSNSLLYYSVKVQPWPLTGSPYTRVLDEGAKAIFDAEYNYAVKNWKEFNDSVK